LFEHPTGGTPESLNSIARNDFVEFHKENFEPGNAVLIFAGDITQAQANRLAQKYFGKWKNQTKREPPTVQTIITEATNDSNSAIRQAETKQPLLKRILVIDLPNSGQAAVSFNKSVQTNGRVVWDDKKKRGSTSEVYYPAIVMNSLLGGGYSSRLNQEIRIKRGLSYGAGSSFAWRWYNTNFGTRTQTKNESAAEVAELVLAEIKKLSEGAIPDAELTPRKSVLTGSFGRNLETTVGLAGAVADLYNFELSPGELNTYMRDVESVSDAKIRDFARQNLAGGDIIIVGDYAVFKADLAKRFPGIKVEVVKADELDVSRQNLRKGGEKLQRGE
jgi:zinc protease